MQKVTLLGSTGSIGGSALDVIARHPDRYQVYALSANQSVAKLVQQCQQFQPKVAVIRDVSLVDELAQELAEVAPGTDVVGGEQGLIEVSRASEVDTVLAAIVGAAGLAPTLAGVQAGKRVLLANKESLVMAGKLFMDAVAQSHCTLLPIDSEHNAIFQCLPERHDGLPSAGVERILLTASGGPFRTKPVAELAAVTPDQACAHPNWSMGRKISVDSATMMNKGLELIEACWLFATGPSNIQVVIHPQSVIHSMVQYKDGSVLAQLGNPDMRTPIAHALAWPERIDAGVQSLDIFDVARLDFEPPNLERFPCLALAMAAAERNDCSAAIVNAANEVAVDAFLNEQIGFTQIASLIESVWQSMSPGPVASLAQVMSVDQEARAKALESIGRGAISKPAH
ncbi:1-deoxy-D-xylulose-5-phosphate reductoisomerase [Halioxenophilus aromaticivorans]|uniref:1-deoxy-D-xylulose-5-phosphate reductoisomerase n=1 Tax=Halioxenophilus aromaticivorans TaxID=1306992 RepID=UPI0031EE6678